MKKTIFVSIVICSIFLFLRLYKLDTSLFFINDIGRDFNILFDWHQTGKLPLLGPQTSVLPINQSAIYFYILYPIYLLTNGYFLSTCYTAILIYLIVFIIGLKYNQKYSLIIFYLVAIYTPVITQTRSVWNPTFTLPFLLISIYSYHLLINKFSPKQLILFGLSISLAVSFSYSIIPLLLAIFIHWLIFNRQHFLKYFLSLSLFFAICNLPTILFEMRHHFLLTTSLFTKTSSFQEHTPWLYKLSALAKYIFSTNYSFLDNFLFYTSILAGLYLVISHKNNHHSLHFITPFLYLCLVILTIVLPFTIQAHYVFAFIGLLFFIIADLPQRIKYSIIIAISIIYLRPSQLNNYFNQAPRTYYQTNSCIHQYCQDNNKSTYVTVNSSYHPWHFGPEFRYLMKKNNCQVSDIEANNQDANRMAIVLDNSSYDTQTSYYELSLFGRSKPVGELNCQDNFRIITLEKI